LFADTLQDFGSRPALIDEDGVILSYSDLAERADALAAQLGPERRLTLVEAGNDVDSIVAYLAALRGRHPVIVTSGPASRDVLDNFHPTVLGHEHHPPAAPTAAEDLHPDLAVLLSTSGTTGSAKLVRLSRENMESNARSIVTYLDIRPDDRAITTLPLGYSYGLSVLNSHLAAGAALILTDRSVVDDAFWALVERHGATSMAGVPYTYELLETRNFRDTAHPTLRTLTQAGGRLAPDRVAAYAAWARENGKCFFTMYGQTEASPRMAYLPPELAEQYPDCIGRPVPGGSIRIDPETHELIYAGPNVMMGYATKIEELALGAGPAELHTGDIGEEVAPDLFRITGRLARFSKIAGLRISLDEIERILAEAGHQALVAGNDHTIAVGVIAPTKVEDAVTVLRNHGAVPDWAFVAVPLETAPRLSSGKPDYGAILAAGLASQAAAAATQADEGFATIFERIMMRAGVSGDDSFSSLAGDSLSYIQITMAIESRLGELPGHWEQLTVSQLDELANAARSKPRGRAITFLPTEIIIRLGAIGAILASHLGPDLGGRSLQGGAIVLLMTAGFNLNNFQRDHLLSDRRWSLIKLFFLRLWIPVYITVGVSVLLRNSMQIGWPTLLMVGNFFAEPRGPLVVLWFIEVLFQCTLGMVLLFCIPAVRRFARHDRWIFALALLAFAVAVKFAFAPITEDYAPNVHGLLRRPDAYFATYVVGWLAAESTTTLRRLLCLALIMGTVLLDHGLTNSHTVGMAMAAPLLLFVPRVPVWRPIATALAFVAGATFYIYLTHQAVIHVFYFNLHLRNLPLVFGVSVAVGIGASAGWNWVMRTAVQLYHRRLAPMLG